MKRLLLFIGLIGLGLLIQSAPVGAKNLDNFVITDYKVQMRLGRDEEKRSTLDARLTITAFFPPNQNHGLAKYFVTEYNGHDTSFKLKSVRDENGNNLKYHWKGDELRIGDKDVYVEGEKTYVIEYSQRDVSRYYADTGKHEFYWDVIGTHWRVPIAKAGIALEIDQELADEVTTKLYCYRGLEGENKDCGIVTSSYNQPSTVYNMILDQLGQGEGVTVSIGFGDDTFAPYKKSFWQQAVEIWTAVQTYLMFIAGGLIIWLFWRYHKLLGRDKELKPIAPEYIPPKFSVQAAAGIGVSYGLVKGSAEVAQLLDLAVRHYIKIYEISPKKFLSAAKYEIEIIKDPKTLKPEELEILEDMFIFAYPNQRLKLDDLKKDTSYSTRLADNPTKLDKLLKENYGLKEKNLEHRRKIRKDAKILLLLAILLLSPPFLIAAFASFVRSFSYSLSDKGLALRRYLEGLKMYIGVAEQERLKMLQSPEGAAKTGVKGTDDQAKLIKLYERVLPYAVLFGQEKQWSEQIGRYYEQIGKQPDWYNGATAFSAYGFASGLSDLSSSTASAISSSTGGSSGGGFSGGGGGGGGGGGW